jgi:hypothetical protein
MVTFLDSRSDKALVARAGINFLPNMLALTLIALNLISNLDIGTAAPRQAASGTIAAELSQSAKLCQLCNRLPDS